MRETDREAEGGTVIQTRDIKIKGEIGRNGDSQVSRDIEISI